MSQERPAPEGPTVECVPPVEHVPSAERVLSPGVSTEDFERENKDAGESDVEMDEHSVERDAETMKRDTETMKREFELDWMRETELSRRREEPDDWEGCIDTEEARAIAEALESEQPAATGGASSSTGPSIEAKAAGQPMIIAAHMPSQSLPGAPTLPRP